MMVIVVVVTLFSMSISMAYKIHLMLTQRSFSMPTVVMIIVVVSFFFVMTAMP